MGIKKAWLLGIGLIPGRFRSAAETPTGESSLIHEIAHELRLCEEDVIQLVHAELVDLIDVLSAVQILMEGLYLPCTSETHTDKSDFKLVFKTGSSLLIHGAALHLSN